MLKQPEIISKIHKSLIRSVLGLALLSVCLTLTAGMKLPEDSSHLSGTGLSVDPTSQQEGYSAILYDNTSGLPTSEANDITETSDGFIWIGGYSGLIRYDGNTFERMDSTSGITSVKCLYVDSKDRLWIGTNDSGIGLLEKGKLTMWGESEGLKASSVRSILEDSNGLIYIATTGGVAVLDTEFKLSFTGDPRVDEDFIQELRIDSDNTVYGVTNSNDIFTLKDGKLISYLSHEYSGLSSINCLFPDPVRPGYIYIEASDTKLYHALYGQLLTDVDAISIAPLSQVQRYEYLDGKLWICARNGVGVYDGEEFIQIKNLPMDNSIGHVMTDYEGNLWFTSSRQGIMKIVPNQFADIFERYNIPEDVVNSTCRYGDMLFIGGDTGLTVIDENGVVDSFPLKSAKTAGGIDLGSDDLISLLNNIRIRSIIQDSKGRLWISTWRKYGLLLLDKDHITSFTVNDGLFTNNVRAVYERADGSILVANTGGVCIIEDNKITERFGEKDGINNTEILSVTEGPTGDIAIGSDGDGIYVIRSADDTVLHISRNEGLTSEAVMRIKWDNVNGVFWIVTGNSIAYMTPDYKLTTIDRFPYSNNYDLYINSDNEVWILCSSGIYVIPAEELLSNGEMSPVHYGMADGLPCIATANSYSEQTATGDLYIAGTTGVAKVNIENHYEKVSDLKVSVPYLDADGERIYPDANGGFTISSKVRKLTIYSYVFNYSLINPQVSYRLDGFDPEDVTILRSDLDPVDYTNLSGGDYRFVIQLQDPMHHNNKTVAIPITKEKAFYEYVWFYVMAILFTVTVLASFIGLFISRKIHQLEEKAREETEKERMATELSTAAKIQESMLPSDFPLFPDRNEFDVYAVMDPAKEVGGDFYDFFLLDDDHLCFEIADVSGKGIPASLVMMISKVILQSFAMAGSSSPSEILTKTNESLCSDNNVDMFVTVWLGILEISTGKIIAANAGHEYPAIMRSGGGFEILKDKHGFVIGGMEGVKYHDYELQLHPGDKIFLYTDGVPEATDSEDELFGLERMCAALNITPDGRPPEILTNVRTAIDSFVKDAEQFDDLTMLCLEYKGPSDS